MYSSHYRRAIIAFLFVAIFAVGCSTKPEVEDGTPINLSGADSLASIWMQALADSLNNLPSGAEAEVYKGIRYTEIRNGFNQALAVNSGSRIAHLGSALLDVIEVNYNAELWEFVDSLTSYTDNAPRPLGLPVSSLEGGLYLQPGSPILGNQFTILATAPREVLRRAAMGIPSNLTIMRLQMLIDDVILPALDSSIQHMERAEAGGGPIVLLSVEDESTEIDLGEILFFDASLRAARAGLKIVNSYDLDLPGPDGTYRWIDDIRTAIDSPCDNFSEIDAVSMPPNVKITEFHTNESDVAVDSILFEVLRHNLEDRSGFLTLRNNRMAEAYQDLLTMRSKLAQAVSSIRNESDPQENDVVKMVDLTDLDQEIAGSLDKPTFAENFTTIEDVLSWVETVLTGTYRVVDIRRCGIIEVDVNVSAIFTNAPSDWRDLLPYHRFLPKDQWVDRDTRSFGFDVTPGATVCFQMCQFFDCRIDVIRHDSVFMHGDVSALELLDGPNGNPIDLNVAKVPYMPDYTLVGLFPNADRSTWRSVSDAVCNRPGWLSLR